MPANRMLRWILGSVAFALLMCGCGRKPEVALEDSAPASPAYAPQSNSSNSFDEYALAALDVEAKAAKYLGRVSYFPAQREAAIEATKPALARALAASSKPCDFKFSPRPPFEKHPYHQGWRLMGRVLAWQIEDAVEAKDYGKAVDIAVKGSRFGFDLTGGGAMDAALGLTIVDDCRKSIAPALDQLDSAHLQQLASGMRKALERQKTLQTTIENEEENMLLAVRHVEQRFTKNELPKLQDEMKSSVKDAVDYLSHLRSDDAQEQEKYFQGFEKEAVTVAGHARKMSGLPAKERTELKEGLAEERPWRRFARHLFGTLELLQSASDATRARTRLLIVTCLLMDKASKGTAPTFEGLDSSITTDPYSGKSFVLMRDDTEFTVYSVGMNLRDDGGDTNETFSEPDLKLERPL